MRQLVVLLLLALSLVASHVADALDSGMQTSLDAFVSKHKSKVESSKKKGAKVHKTKHIEDITKSALDDRQYRYFQLENGIHAIVISDNDTVASAASMDVSVGYFEDPEEMPGVAHFLEHMLFMGTKKYPDENDYENFLSEHGGGSNAYTSMENTNYYFDIQPAHLEAILDRFAQFFISPLLTDSATDRERNAVNNENQKNLQNDDWRLMQLLKSITSDKLPYQKFGTGNINTLKGEKLRSNLLEFYKKHYVAPNMKLCIVGREDLDTLENLVREKFADVPQGPKGFTERHVDAEDQSKEIIPEHNRASMFYVETVRDSRSLWLVFPVPAQRYHYRYMTASYVGELLSSPTKNSAYHQLKNRGWVSDIGAGLSTTTSIFDTFEVTISLTNEGLKHVDEIVQEFFNYLYLIEDKGVDKWRYSEMAQIAQVHFDIKDKEPPQHYVSAISEALAYLPPKDILVAGSLYMQYNKKHIKSFLRLLRPDNMIAFLCQQAAPDGIKLDQTERWYGTKYHQKPFSAEQLESWSREHYEQGKTALALPGRNEFLPKDTSLHQDDQAQNMFPFVLLHEKEKGLIAWFKQDKDFDRPKANLFYKLYVPDTTISPKHSVMSALIVSLVGDVLEETAYQATRAGFSYSFSSSDDGFVVAVRGFNSGLQAYTEFVFKAIKEFKASKKSFERIKEEMLQQYANFKFMPPHKHATYSASMFLSQQHWHMTQFAEALRDIELSDVKSYAKDLFSDMFVECFLHGNLQRDEADYLARVPQFAFKYSPIDRFSGLFIANRIVTLQRNVTIVAPVANQEESNSVAYAYFQFGPRSNEVEVLSEVLASIMDKPCYHQLRTVEQLGYIVWSGQNDMEGVSGFSILVQSSTHDAKYLRGRIDSFVKQFRKTLEDLTEEELKQFVTTVITSQLQEPNSLSDESMRYWTHISSAQYEFDRRFKKVHMLQKLTKDHLVSFYDRFFLGRATQESPATEGSLPAASVQIFGRAYEVVNLADGPEPKKHPKKGVERILVGRPDDLNTLSVSIENALKFKNGQFFYPARPYHDLQADEFPEEDGHPEKEFESEKKEAEIDKIIDEEWLKRHAHKE